MRNLLNVHQRIHGVHSKERPYVCDIEGCDRSYPYEINFKRQKSRSHGIYSKKFDCSFCNRIFHRKNSCEYTQNLIRKGNKWLNKKELVWIKRNWAQFLYIYIKKNTSLLTIFRFKIFSTANSGISSFSLFMLKKSEFGILPLVHSVTSELRKSEYGV